MPREVDGAFPVERVPAGRISLAEKLGLQTDSDHRFLHRRSDNAVGRLPTRAAGGPPDHFDGKDAAMAGGHRKFGGAESPTENPQADLPGKPASGGRGDGSGPCFPRGDHGNAQIGASDGEVGREIRMTKVIQGQVALDGSRQIRGRLIDQRRKLCPDVDGNHPESAVAVPVDAGDLAGAAAVFLKNHDGLYRFDRSASIFILF